MSFVDSCTDTVVAAEWGEPLWVVAVIMARGGLSDPTVPDFLQVGNVDPVGWLRWWTASVRWR